MSSTTLTIAIPSYNRCEKVKVLISKIADQPAASRLKIIVLDNNSVENYSQVLTEFSGILKNKVTVEVIRNSVNIGMSGNILRCFEDVKTEWLWILSDDDEVSPDAIDNIIKTIDYVEDSINIIKFSSERSFPEYNGELLTELPQLIDYCSQSHDNFNGFIFLSNLIYRTSKIKPFVEIGYKHAHTYVPHFMMVCKALDDIGKIYMSTHRLVTYVRPEIGYSYAFVAGLGVGAFKEIELSLDKSYYKKFISLFFPHNDWKVIVDLRYYCMTKKQEFRYHHIANEYLKNSSVGRNFFKTAALYAFKNIIGNKNIFSGFFAALPILSKRHAIEAREIAMRYRENDD